MLERESGRHRILRIAQIIAFPLLASCVGIGIALSFMYFGTKDLYDDATTGRRAYETERFRLWFESASAEWMSKEARGEELERLFDELVGEYEVDEEAIPAPIDVFLHDSVDSFRSHLFVRKGSNTRFITPAPLDLLVSEDPRGRLGELVLTFGWGRVVSRVFQVGMSLLLAHPEYDFHAVISGLSDEQVLDLEQVLRMESRGRLPSTIYHAYDSPYTTAMLGSLTDLRSLMGLEGGQASLPDDLVSLEAASICQFIIETLGASVMRSCWDRGDTAELLRTRTGYETLEELGRDWLEHATSQGANSEQHASWSARSELARGNPRLALSTLDTNEETLDANSGLVLAFAALAAGDLAAFDDLRSRLPAADLDPEAAAWLDAFSGAIVVLGDGFVAVGPAPFAEQIENTVRQAETTRASVTEIFRLARDSNEPTSSLFFYRDRESAAFGAELTPTFKNIRSQDHYFVLAPELDERIQADSANATLAQAFGEMSYSQLLRAGAIHLAREDEAALLDRGAQLVRDSRWHPLRSLQIGSVAEDVGNTEAALLIRYIVDHCGAGSFEQMWVSTAVTTQFHSFDSALRNACGTTRSDVEESILEELLGGD